MAMISFSLLSLDEFNVRMGSCGSAMIMRTWFDRTSVPGADDKTKSMHIVGCAYGNKFPIHTTFSDRVIKEPDLKELFKTQKIDENTIVKIILKNIFDKNVTFKAFHAKSQTAETVIQYYYSVIEKAIPQKGTQFPKNNFHTSCKYF